MKKSLMNLSSLEAASVWTMTVRAARSYWRGEVEVKNIELKRIFKNSHLVLGKSELAPVEVVTVAIEGGQPGVHLSHPTHFLLLFLGGKVITSYFSIGSQLTMAHLKKIM